MSDNILDLQCCFALGATADDTLHKVMGAKQAWLASAHTHKQAIPKPRYRLATYV